MERHLRTLQAAGVRSVSVAAAGRWVVDEAERARSRGMEVELVPARTGLGEWLREMSAAHGRVLVVDMDYLIDPVLVRVVLDSAAATVLTDSDPPPSSRNGARRLAEFAARAPQSSVDRQSGAYFCGIVSVDNDNRVGSQVSAAGSLHELVTCLLQQPGDKVCKLDVAGLPTFQSDIRRKRRPIWMPCYEPDQLDSAKRAVVASAQKGSLDWPAQWIHAPLENGFVARICETTITPNQLTLITNIAAWTVTWLFLSGHILAGLLGAAVVGVLDGMDGKLARVKLMTSKIGEYEHVFDLVFEYSWWFALGWTLSAGDVASPVFSAAVVLVTCSFVDSMATVGFLYWRGRHVGRTLDNYTRTDYLIRKVAGRRNVYIWLMLVGVLLTDPVTAFYAATGWAVVTCVVRGARALIHVATPLVERPADDFLG